MTEVDKDVVHIEGENGFCTLKIKKDKSKKQDVFFPDYRIKMIVVKTINVQIEVSSRGLLVKAEDS